MIGREAGPGRVPPEPVPCAGDGCDGDALEGRTLCAACIEASYTALLEAKNGS